MLGCDSESQYVSLTVDALPSLQANQRTVSATIEPINWDLTVKIGLDDVPMMPSGNYSEWISEVIEVDQQNTSISVAWRYNEVLVADYTGTVNFSANGFKLRAEDYQTNGDRFDADGDGLSNYVEILNDFDPLDNQTPLSSTLGASIPYVDSSSAPIIDGTFDSIWSDGVGLDWRGQGLRIDNLMIDRGAVTPDDQAQFQWSAMHDGEYLYLIIFGENTDNNNLQGDSTVISRDDNISLVIDGDNSKLNDYDGVNDYSWSIAQLDILKPAGESYSSYTAAVDDNGDLIRDQSGNLAISLGGETIYVPPQAITGNSNLLSTSPNRIIANNNSASNPVELKFAACVCGFGQHLLEIKLKLADVDIEVGRTFGLELQLDDDTNGGDIEGRYGWSHPSISSLQEGQDPNNTRFIPSYAGTAILLPRQPL